MSFNDDSFFVILPSNSSMHYFPDNTTTKFITKLPRQIQLQGEWLVSLVEIAYPMTLLHIPSSGNLISFEDGDHDLSTINQLTRRSLKRDPVPSGVYRSIDDLMSTINKLPHMSGHLLFTLSRSGQVEVTRVCEDQRYHDFRVSPAIARLLGFTEEACRAVEIAPRGKYVGSRPASLSGALPSSMFVYSDICETYITGDVQTPLLRVVSIDADNFKYGATKIKSFSAPRYIPLIRNNLQTIEIDIRDEFGNAIPFEQGTLTVTLHFKRH